MDLPIDFRNPGTGQMVARLDCDRSDPGHRVTLTLFDGEVVNVRNVQGGVNDDPNLDLSAGGDGSPGQPRGNVGINWDNGNHTNICDGRKNISLQVTGYDDRAKCRVAARVPLRLWHGAEVPTGFDSTGRPKGWRKAL